MSFWKRRRHNIGNHEHLTSQVLDPELSPPGPFDTGNTLGFELIELVVDLSTVPNTEDNAVVEQAGVTIEGPAWVEGRLVSHDVALPVGVDRADMSVCLLPEEWTSGLESAVPLIGRQVLADDELLSVGGIFQASTSSGRYFVSAGVTARVGLHVQPSDPGTGDPVAGQMTGTIRVAIIVSSPGE